MKLYLPLVALVAFAVATSANDDCPTATITFGGSSTVYPLAVAWANGYRQQCANTNIVVEDPTGSLVGARRVCDQSDDRNDAPLDVGTMSEEWESSNATTTNGYIYECAKSSRAVIQLDVAIDGLSVVTAQTGPAYECIQKLGGLTIEQLRWIYSSKTLNELVLDGWDRKSVKNLDSSDFTHKWSELHEDCEDVEIKISGPSKESGTYHHFKDLVFAEEDDDFPFDGRTSTAGIVEYFHRGGNQDLVNYVEQNLDAISFFGYSYAAHESANVATVPIRNSDGEFVAPNAETIFGGEYPFARRIYMNVLNDGEVIDALKNFFVYAYSKTGTQVVEDLNMVAIPFDEREVMLARIKAPTGISVSGLACGPAGTINIAGSSTVKPVADLWAGIYQVKCHNSVINVEGGGSSMGASRVCGTGSSAVDIGTMSREWYDKEASTQNGFEYKCKDSSRSVIQLEVAIDGITIAVQHGGVAHKCLKHLDGLTIDQLRWMYSSYTEDQLRANGWSATSIPNRDSDPDTHFWSELYDHPDCPSTEIKISGADVNSGTYDMFVENVLLNNAQGESIDVERTEPYFNSEVDEDLVQYLKEQEDAISFFGYAYYVQNEQDVAAIAIRNEQGNYVGPSAVNMQDGSYSPFSRRIYMNIVAEESSLALTRPFLEFGLSDQGENMVRKIGYSPIADVERIIMKTRAQTKSGIPHSAIQGESCSPEKIQIAGSSTVFPLAELWGGIYEIGCNISVDVAGGGSSVGADRLCGEGDFVDIATMSRDWKGGEAKVRKDGYTFECSEYDTTRTSLQMHVARDGLTIAVGNGTAAAECLQLMGGLTLDQLRWMYSSYDEEQLKASFWDANAIPHSDNDPTTHKWSEFKLGCVDAEIKIAGPDILSGTNEYFKESVLVDHADGEDFASNRPNGYRHSPYDEELVKYVLDNPTAVAFFGYSYYYANKEILAAAPLWNKEYKAYYKPDSASVNALTYPLARTLYMNLYNEPESLARTVPFMKFAYSKEGIELLGETGYVPVPKGTDFGQERMVEILDDLSGEEEVRVDADEGGIQPGGIAALVLSGVFGCCLFACIYLGGAKVKGDTDPNPFTDSAIA